MGKISIVIGLGYGDEGKGLVTSSLAELEDSPTIVRFSGGPQAGHTVVNGDFRHVFSSFGSTTNPSAITLWSEFCPVNPVALKYEKTILEHKKITPVIVLNGLCPVITPYDIIMNQSIERFNGENRHGSVGVGIGTTMHRHYKTEYKFHLMEVIRESIMNQKLDAIKSYYDQFLLKSPAGLKTYYDLQCKTLESSMLTDFQKACAAFYRYNNHMFLLQTPLLKGLKINTNPIIFEGSQGTLLDMDHGIFPNVTYANTTVKNALKLIDRNNMKDPIDIYFVTRCYSTRHGNGPLAHEGEIEPFLINKNPNETNVKNEFQGSFRLGVLDLEILRYAVDINNIYINKDKDPILVRKNLVITCMDQIKEAEGIPIYINNHLSKITPKKLRNNLEMDRVFISRSEKTQPLQEIIN